MAVVEKDRSLALDASAWFFVGQVGESEPVRHMPLRTMPFKIGRKAGLDMTLPCNCVSGEHAEIFERDNKLWVRDLGSTNGTYVNGEQVVTESLLQEGDLIQLATVVFRVSRAKEDHGSATVQEDTGDHALAMVQFNRLFSGAVVPFYQPIVEVNNGSIVGYEVLGRSRLFGLQSPAQMFATASKLDLEAELSRVFRHKGVEIADKLPDEIDLYVNTHPVELHKDGLIDSLRMLRAMSSSRKITLEIHEAAVTNPEMICSLREVLVELDMSLAFDDFGAGQARLVELSEVRPEVLKFDMKLVQGIHRAPAGRQQVVALLVKMVNELGITPLAEGVELAQDHETLCQMGFHLGQGFYYGRPAPIAKALDPSDSGETDLSF